MTRRGRLKPPRWPAGDGGQYVLLLYLPRRLYLEAGRLSGVHVEPGFVFYVGRARRNLFARLARHMRRRKPRRWHIDYLFPAAIPLGAWVFAGDEPAECEIADRIERRNEVRRIIPGFGASDCRCKGHLLWASGENPLDGLSEVQRIKPPVHFAGSKFFDASAW